MLIKKMLQTLINIIWRISNFTITLSVCSISQESKQPRAVLGVPALNQ